MNNATSPIKDYINSMPTDAVLKIRMCALPNALMLMKNPKQLDRFSRFSKTWLKIFNFLEQSMS